jgi:hypothetical protein
MCCRDIGLPVMDRRCRTGAARRFTSKAALSRCRWRLWFSLAVLRYEDRSAPTATCSRDNRAVSPHVCCVGISLIISRRGFDVRRHEISFRDGRLGDRYPARLTCRAVEKVRLLRTSSMPLSMPRLAGIDARSVCRRLFYGGSLRLEVCGPAQDRWQIDPERFRAVEVAELLAAEYRGRPAEAPLRFLRAGHHGAVRGR